MPVSTFRCTAGHANDAMHAMGARPHSVACTTCGGEAHYVPTVGRGLIKGLAPVRNKDASRPSDFRWREVRCTDPACARVTLEDVPLADPPEYRCEKCGGPTTLGDLAMIDRFSERFPYFDRGLGCWVTSKQHRLEVCRQQGVVPVDGDLDIDGAIRKHRARQEAEDAAVAAMYDRMEHSPDFAAWRRQRDREEEEKRDRRARGLPATED